MKESNYAKKVLPEWQRKNGMDSHVFRNNTGMAYQGEKIPSGKLGTVILNKARIIFFGVGLWRRKTKKGSSRPCGGGDYIGWTSKIICDVIPEVLVSAVRKCCDKKCNECRIAVFTSLELKTKNVKETKEQKEWKELVIKSGGIAEVINE